MASLAEREALRGKVQMIYIDPPYGIKFGSNWQVSARKRDVKDGKLEDAAREVEQIKAFRDTWELGIHSYLTYLRDRLLVARDLLTETGSCFVQIGDENVHLVRSLMDEVFGSENFVSQITFKTTSGAGSYGGRCARRRQRLHPLVRQEIASTSKYRPLYRSKRSASAVHEQYTQRRAARRRRDDRLTSGRAIATSLPTARDLLPRQSDLTDQCVGQTTGTSRSSSTAARIIRQRAAGRRTATGWSGSLLRESARSRSANTLGYVRYLDDFPRVAVHQRLGRHGHSGLRGPTRSTSSRRTPRSIERCMLMMHRSGDLVLDPTCGSGTTAYVAEQWGRRWITIDTSRVALALARQRLMGARFPCYLLADSPEGAQEGADAHGAAAAAQPSSRTTSGTGSSTSGSSTSR